MSVKESKCKLIDIEGIDGSGKTTQAKMLKEFLEGKGYSVSLFKEPTDGEIGRQIRKILREGVEPDAHKMAELYARDRYDNYLRNVKPALEAGKIVIMDRYVVSSMAYQCAGGVPLEKVARLNDFAPKPDLVIIIDIPVDLAIKRMLKMGKEIDSFERREFLKKVREKYIQLPHELRNLRGWEGVRIEIINGNREPLEVFSDIKNIIVECIGDP